MAKPLWESRELIVARGYLHSPGPPGVSLIKNSKADFLDHLRTEAWTWASYGVRGLTVVSNLLEASHVIHRWTQLSRLVESDRNVFEKMFKARPACDHYDKR